MPIAGQASLLSNLEFQAKSKLKLAITERRRSANNTETTNRVGIVKISIGRSELRLIG